MDKVIHLYQGTREVGAYAWTQLPLQEQAVLAKSQELFGRRHPCTRQRRVIRTAILLELERALAERRDGRVPFMWRRYVDAPPCDTVRFGPR